MRISKKFFSKRKYKPQVASKHQSDGFSQPISLYHLQINPFACRLYCCFCVIPCWGWVPSIRKAFLLCEVYSIPCLLPHSGEVEGRFAVKVAACNLLHAPERAVFFPAPSQAGAGSDSCSELLMVARGLFCSANFRFHQVLNDRMWFAV